MTFSTRKTLALLFYLALEAGEQPREHLATLFWPEAAPARSYASLRNTLGYLQTTLRQVSGLARPPYLNITRAALGLNPEAPIALDLQTVAQAYTLARAERASRTLPEGKASLPLLQAAAACQRADFLAGFSLSDAAGFDDWVANQREVWRRRLGLILDRLSEIQFAQGEFAGAAETATRWLSLDTLNEVAYRRKMRAHFAAGERGQALESYEVCRSVLAAELSVEPEPDTAALATRIRAARIHAPHKSVLHRPAPPVPPKTPVAFLENLFVGRQREHQLLVKGYERAAAGQPQCMVLRGAAGIGKTRLAQEFLTWAGAQGAEILQGSTFESDSHLPFQPLVEALRWQLIHENSPLDLLEAVWLAALSQLLPELRARYPNLPPAPQPPADPKAAASQTQVFEPLAQLTLALAQRTPLVLFVDDLQWADSATLEALHYALRRWQVSAARVLLLVTLRTEALLPAVQPQAPGSPQRLSQWLSHMEHEVPPGYIELEPLSELETMQLMQSILAPAALDFAQWLYAETHGQPFYLMETLKDLLERRVLHPRRQTEGRWTFAIDAEHNLGQAVRVPSTVRTVIRARLQRLSPHAFSLLAGGAVLEQGLTFERLCAIANVPEDLALPALDELLSGRLLLEAAQPAIASAYTLANDMFRDVMYTEAGDARRRLFHRRALEMLLTFTLFG